MRSVFAKSTSNGVAPAGGMVHFVRSVKTVVPLPPSAIAETRISLFTSGWLSCSVIFTKRILSGEAG